MKKGFIILLLVCLTSFKIYSQSIHFENVSWQAALLKAKEENKPVFIDVYATWCGYCRQMNSNIFPLAEVGSFYNAHFINIKCDIQKKDGHALLKRYPLSGLPAFLYLNPDGTVLKKTEGYQEKDAFIQQAVEAVASVQKQ